MDSYTKSPDPMQDAFAYRAATLGAPSRTYLQLNAGCLLRNVRLIALILLACLCLAAMYLAARPGAYTARLNILLDKRELQIPSPDVVFTTSTTSVPWVNTQVALFRSEKIALQVVDRLKLYSDPEFQGEGVLGALGPIGGAPNLDGPALRNENPEIKRAIKTLLRRLSVNRIGETFLVELGLRASTPEKAALIVSAVAQAYLDELSVTSAQEAAGATAWLRDRIRASGPSARIVTQPKPPFDRDPPGVLMTLALATIMGLGLGVGIALAKENLNSTLRTPDRLEAVAGVRCAGIVPHLVARPPAVCAGADGDDGGVFNCAAEIPPAEAAPWEDAEATDGYAAEAVAEETEEADTNKAAAVAVDDIAEAATKEAAHAAVHRTADGEDETAAAEVTADDMTRDDAGPNDEAPSDHTATAVAVALAPKLFDIEDAVLTQTVDTAATSLLLERRDHCIGVTSTHRGDGKSLVAWHLAKVATSGGRKVLLVDAGGGADSISQKVNVGSLSGLSDVLQGQASLDEVVVKDVRAGLDLVPIGSSIIANGVAMGSPHFLELLKAATERYDLIIVDLPAAGSSAIVQAAAQHIDGIVLVTRWGRTRAQDVASVLETQTTVRSRLVMTVLNDVDVAQFATFPSASTWLPPTKRGFLNRILRRNHNASQ